MRKTASKPATVTTLAQDLKSLETRLKGADTKNRNALKALEGVVADIKTAAKSATTTQKAALTRGLNTLENQMETYVERAAAKARASVRAEFSGVTAAGANFGTIEEAVQAAHNRLDSADALQRDSLARMSRHIADLATSVDRRLNVETQARETASAELDAKIETVRDTLKTRVDKVEQDTADALKAVGSKIAEFSSVLEDRAKASDVNTAERLADLAQETQSDFNSAQTDVSARLEALEMIASSWSPEDKAIPANPYLPANADDPRIDKMSDMISDLQSELDRMHARMATLQNAPTGAAPIAPSTAPLAAAAPSNIVSMSPLLDPAPENPYAAAARALEISTPEPAAPSSPVPGPVPAPVAPKSEKPAAEAHVPQEFDPTAYSAQSAPEVSRAPALDSFAPPAMPVPPLPLPPLAPPSAPLTPPMASTATYVPLQPDLQTGEPLMPAPLPVSTYDDPAYAEDEMRAERIGVEAPKRPGLPNLPITGRTLRVGAMAVGVGVVGLFAFKAILGGPDAPSTQVQNDAPALTAAQGAGPLGTVQNAGITAAPQPGDADFSGTPTQGQYAETRTPTLIPGAQDSLDAAVEAGNPIAQFQKGLVQLQAGQMQEGARLIRLAANRNQPAAQYRLAKLYESGTGIREGPHYSA